MTDQPRTANPQPADEPARTVPDVGVRPAETPTETAGVAHRSDTVRVFTGSELPEPGSAEAISAIEDSSPSPGNETPASAEPTEARESISASPPASTRKGALVGSGLLGGIAGAGLTLGAQALWLRPPEHLNDRLAQLEQRVGTAPSQDTVAANERRLGALEAELKGLDGRVRSAREMAEAAGKRADEVANRPPPGPDPAQVAAVAQTGARITALERLLAERTEAAAGAQSGMERRLAEQEGRLAELAQRLTASNPQRLEAGLRVIAADQVGAALQDGQPLGPSLSVLERLKIDASTLSALRPFAAAPPPSAAVLLRDFKPLADRIRAEQQPAAGTNWSGKLLNLADQVVTIRQTGPAPGGGDAQDGVGRIEAALGAGALAQAAAAWDGLPAPAKAISQTWAESLKQRVAAEEAASQLSTQAAAAFEAATR